MKKENEIDNFCVIRSLMLKHKMVASDFKGVEVADLAGDGSNRKFWRIVQDGRSICLAVAPPSRDESGMAEALAVRNIGLHLYGKNLPVPEQYAWDSESGVLLFEDFGDLKLHDYVLTKRKEQAPDNSFIPLYRKVVETLVAVQIAGAESFDSGWCWDTPEYDKKLMIERESGYFMRAFWQGLLDKNVPDGLADEFVELAEEAAAAGTSFFIHRDFQSRNIMLQGPDRSFGVIDFQGGRLGPSGYDLASLLIDPYVALDPAVQEELLEFYLDRLQERVAVDRVEFKHLYNILSLHRNLQIVGAFAFLSEQRGKLFFRQFLPTALESLDRLVHEPQFHSYKIVVKCIAAGRHEYSKRL